MLRFSPALRGYLEKLQNSCQMRVREPREDWNTSSAENMDMTDRIVAYTTHMTKLVTSVVRGPVYFQLLQDGLIIEIRNVCIFLE